MKIVKGTESMESEDLLSLISEVHPNQVWLDKEKVEKWIKNGAKPTDTVKALIEKAN